ncbi:MAG: hypothetical protein ACK40M_07995 [Flavobacteriales bacterium]
MLKLYWFFVWIIAVWGACTNTSHGQDSIALYLPISISDADEKTKVRLSEFVPLNRASDSIPVQKSISASIGLSNWPWPRFKGSIVGGSTFAQIQFRPFPLNNKENWVRINYCYKFFWNRNILARKNYYRDHLFALGYSRKILGIGDRLKLSASVDFGYKHFSSYSELINNQFEKNEFKGMFIQISPIVQLQLSKSTSLNVEWGLGPEWGESKLIHNYYGIVNTWRQLQFYYSNTRMLLIYLTILV